MDRHLEMPCGTAGPRDNQLAEARGVAGRANSEIRGALNPRERIAGPGPSPRTMLPRREAGLRKAEIRALSQELGLPTWDKPATACLASRIPFGERITAEKLAQVARGEAFLHQAGFRACRLRHHGTIARLEVPPAEIPALLAQAAEVVAALKGLGFAYVTVDLQGLRSGSMHEAAGKRP